jgi:hypothetical protein
MSDFSIKEQHISPEITQPSDLFGLEILSECTFESEYGKLTLSPVVVPDFSSDEKGAIRLKEEFENLKLFIAEKEFSRKGDVAELVCENEFSCVDQDGQPKDSNYFSRSSEAFSEFILLLKASIGARLFEIGHSINRDLCIEFGYDDQAQLSSGRVLYNDVPVVQPLSCAGGVYAYCLHYALNPDIFCPQDYIGLRNDILNEGIPTHNYLSWAFSHASNDEWMITFVSYMHFGLA